MTHSVLEVTNGPAKDDLLRAVTNEQLTTVFDTPAGALETSIDRLEEQGDDGAGRTDPLPAEWHPAGRAGLPHATSRF
jgi:hypothetical protein